jgi:hypothetical protein
VLKQRLSTVGSRLWALGSRLLFLGKSIDTEDTEVTESTEEDLLIGSPP